MASDWYYKCSRIFFLKSILHIDSFQRVEGVSGYHIELWCNMLRCILAFKHLLCDLNVGQQQHFGYQWSLVWLQMVLVILIIIYWVLEILCVAFWVFKMYVNYSGVFFYLDHRIHLAKRPVHPNHKELTSLCDLIAQHTF